MIGEDDSGTIIHVKLLAWHSNFKKHKAYKEDKWRINANSVAS